jgi:PEP-CTERM motif
MKNSMTTSLNLNRLFKTIFVIFLVVTTTKTAHSQAPYAIYGTEFSAAGSLKILQIVNPNLASGSVSTAIDVTGFTVASGKILGAPAGTAITGTTLNSIAWDQSSKRAYFRDNAGQGNFYYWSPGATTINYVASAATLMPGAISLLADNGTIYNGGYFYMEDKTDTLSRYDLALGTVRRFTGISGALARTYDYGDIAVSSAGVLYINGPITAGGNNLLDKVDISTITASGGTPTGFTAIVNYGADFAGKTQQIAFDASGTNLYAVQSLGAGGASAATFAAQTWHSVNLTTGAQGATIWTSANNFSDLSSGFVIPEPSSLALAILGLGGVGWRRRRKPLEKTGN